MIAVDGELIKDLLQVRSPWIALDCFHLRMALLNQQPMSVDLKLNEDPVRAMVVQGITEYGADSADEILELLHASAHHGAPPPSPQVSYAPGYDWSRCVDDPRALATALELASAAEIVILLLGLPGSYETEGCDREHMRLPSQMNNLCRALAQQVLAPRRLVVVIFGGAAVELPWAGEDL